MSPAFAPTSCVPEKPRFSYISFNLEKCLNLSENSHIYIYRERERGRERGHLERSGPGNEKGSDPELFFPKKILHFHFRDSQELEKNFKFYVPNQWITLPLRRLFCWLLLEGGGVWFWLQKRHVVEKATFELYHCR